MRTICVVTIAIVFAACGSPNECETIPLGTRWRQLSSLKIIDGTAFVITGPPQYANLGRVSKSEDGGVARPFAVGGRYSSGPCSDGEYGEWACYAWVEDGGVVGLSGICRN